MGIFTRIKLKIIIELDPILAPNPEKPYYVEVREKDYMSNVAFQDPIFAGWATSLKEAQQGAEAWIQLNKYYLKRRDVKV